MTVRRRAALETSLGPFPIPEERPPDDAALAVLIAELRASSAVAERWWETHDVAHKRYGFKPYRHPVVGDLTLHL